MTAGRTSHARLLAEIRVLQDQSETFRAVALVMSGVLNEATDALRKAVDVLRAIEAGETPGPDSVMLARQVAEGAIACATRNNPLGDLVRKALEEKLADVDTTSVIG